MILEDRRLEQTNIRHLTLPRGIPSNVVVWWYGAILKNRHDAYLPLVYVWFRRLNEDGTLGSFVREKVGVTELALLQLGTVWNDGFCKSQIRLEERGFQVDFSAGGWRHVTQAASRSEGGLIPQNLYPLHYGLADRTDLLAFCLRGEAELLLPSLEFYSRCYGRSAEVNRVLMTYSWEEAESRLHMPPTEPVPPGAWSVKLRSRIHDGNAMFVAHIKHDDHARNAAKKIKATLEAQFKGSTGRAQSPDGHVKDAARDKGPDGYAFPEIDPWFTGPATLIVQGIPIGRRRFLGLRIVGTSEPDGPEVVSFRENASDADKPAPENAPESGWTGGGDRHAGDRRPFVNVTPTDSPGHDGDTADVLNPELRIVGKRRKVTHRKLEVATTKPGPYLPKEPSVRHSPSERQGAGGQTGLASIHTETALEFEGAARDVWNGLLHLHTKHPDMVPAVGWYDASTGTIDFTNREPRMVSLLSRGEEPEEIALKLKSTWIYADPVSRKIRGVLVAFVKTPDRDAYLFEVERRIGPRKAKDGSVQEKEQPFSGLIVSPPKTLDPGDWIPAVLAGIREEAGVMASVMTSVRRPFPQLLIGYYRRSSSNGDEIAGHSTVVGALRKVGIDVPRSPRDRVRSKRKSLPERRAE